MDEQRSKDIKQAGLRSRSAMTWLRDHQLPAEPVSYTLAYEYLFTDNNELKSQVDSVDLTATDYKDSLETIYHDSIIRKHYTDLSMRGENVKQYVSEVLSLLIDSQSDLDTICHAANRAKTAIAKSEPCKDAARLLVETADNLEHCGQQLKSKLEKTSIELENIQDHYLSLKEEASKDELTQVLDVIGMSATLTAAASQPDNFPFCILRVNLDHFRQFNNANGTVMGDAVLRHLARSFSSHLKGTDIVSRGENDEFILILPKTSISDGVAVADTLRKKVEAVSLKKKGALAPVKVTISVGVSELTTEGNIDQALTNAKNALLRSKDLGRNCVNREN